MRSRRTSVDRSVVDRKKREYVGLWPLLKVFSAATSLLLLGYILGAISHPSNSHHKFQDQQEGGLMRYLDGVMQSVVSAQLWLALFNMLFCILLSGASVVLGVWITQKCQRYTFTAIWGYVLVLGFCASLYGAAINGKHYERYMQSGSYSWSRAIFGQVLLGAAIGALDTVFHTASDYHRMQENYQEIFMHSVLILTIPWHMLLQHNPCLK